MSFQHVTSADPKENPAFDARYYEEEIDIDIIVDTLKFIRKVVQTEPFSKIVEQEELPGLDVQTDEQLYGVSIAVFAAGRLMLTAGHA